MSSLLSKLKNARSGVGDAVRAWRRRHTHDWLSDRVKQEAREYRKAHSTRQSLPDQVRQTWTRDGFWIGVVIALVLVVALSLLLYLLAPGLVDDDRWYGLLMALWQVEASLAGVTFVIVALLLESRAREARSDDIFRYYINACRLIPLVTATFLHILLLGVVAYLRFGSDLRGSLLDVSVIALSMGFGLFVVANLLLWLKVLQLLGPTSLVTAHRELVRTAIEKAIPAITAEESGRRLLEGLLRDSKIEYQPLGFRSEWWQLTAKTGGLVTDVDLLRLEEATQALESQPQGCRVELLVNLGDRVTADTALAVAGPDPVPECVKRPMQRVIRITRAKAESEDTLVRALQLLGDSSIEALRTGQVGECRAHLDVCADSLRLLLALWCDQPHALEFSERPKEYIFSGPRSRVVSILCEIVKRVMGQAAASGDEELVKVAMDALSALLRTSFDADQLGLYRLLTEQVVTAYVSHLSQRDAPFRTKAIGIWQSGIEDLVRGLYHSERPASVETESEWADRINPYIWGVQQMYTHLLKSASDLGDMESFQGFGRALTGLRGLVVCPLGSFLGPANGPNDPGFSTDLAWYAIGAWILKQIMDGAQENGETLGLACKHLTDFEKLRGLWRQFRVDYGALTGWFGWDNWLMGYTKASKGWHDAVFRAMRTFYCFQGARLLSSALATDGANQYQPALQFEDEYEVNSLSDACRRIIDAKDRLTGVIGEEALARLEEFVNLHRSSDRPPDGYA